MSIQATIKQYSIIIEQVNSGNYPSVSYLYSKLKDDGFKISKRTFERYIEQIRLEFGLEMPFSEKNKGYHFSENDKVNLNKLLKFIEFASTAYIFTDSFSKSKENLNYISFETDDFYAGISNIKELLFACKNNRVIQFEHNNFDSNKLKSFTAQAHFLKEYQGRWYLVAYISDISAYRTFGVERIKNIKVTAENFKQNTNLDAKKLFENIIGLVYTNEALEEVRLSFTPKQAKYVKSLPWHWSQKVEIENENEVIISYQLQVNYELIQKILMMGDQVKIQHPQHLADEIEDILTAALKNYQK